MSRTGMDSQNKEAGMRRLAGFMNISSYFSRRAGLSLAIITLLVFAFGFASLAHGQTTKVTSNFEDGQMDGWQQNGNPTTLEVSTDMAHGGTHSLKVAGRVNSWDGAAIPFDAIMQPGEAWVFEVWIRLAPGTAAEKVYLQTHDTADTISGWGGYPYVTDPNTIASSTEWVLLKGRYPIRGGRVAGGTDLKVYVTTTNTTTNYYIDDFVAYKEDPSGCYSTPDISGIATDFETGLQGWGPRPYSGVTVATSNADKFGGAFSMLQTGRTQPWNTAGYEATGKMCNGSSYIVSAWVKLAPSATTPISMNVGAKAIVNSGSTTAPVESDTYLTLTPTKTVDNTGWVQLTGTFDMKTNYDSLWVYVQPTTDQTSSFYVDDFNITYIPAGQSVEDLPSIGAAYASYFRVGAAVYGPDVDATNLHSQLLGNHFTSVTAENDMKWANTEATENAFDYTKADAIVSFAKNHAMAVRGHTLVWHNQTPDWVFKNASGVDMSTLPYSDANKVLLWGRMKNHIQNLITHFGADVSSWDVVNEAFDESQSDGFRHSKWYIISGGAGYIDEAFKDAKEAVDNAGLTGKVKLYLNDYNTTVPSKLNFIKTYLSAAKTAGVPIDGVGHQFHNKLDWPINDDPESIKTVTNALDAVANLGFDNQVTEFDMSIYRASVPGQTIYQSYADIQSKAQNDLLIQGYRYRDYFSAFKTLAEAGKLSSVTMWGLADDHTWLTTSSATDAPLVFDTNFTHKPAYTGIMDATTLPNALPYAENANVEAIFNKPQAITLRASDANLDPLTYTITSQPTNGTLGDLSGTSVTYTPNVDYAGADTFTFKVNDGNGDSNVATITLNVVGPPVAADQSLVTNFNTAKSITLSATTTGLAPMVYTVVSQPAHGALSGTAPALTYTPAKDYWGADSFTFKANNGTDSNVATVSMNILPATAVAKDQSITIAYNTPTLITLSSTASGTTTYTIVSGPKGKGTLVASPANQTTTWLYTNDTSLDPYLASPTDAAEDSFTFIANNGHDSNVGTVSITLKPAALNVTAAAGQPNAATVKAGDSATFHLQVNGYEAYSSHSMAAVNFACGGIPNYATCTVTPSQVTLDDNMTPVAFSVTIKTNTGGAAAASVLPGTSWPGMPWIFGYGLGVFALIFMGIKTARLRWRLIYAMALLLLIASFPSCGGNTVKSNNNMVATPSGTYTVTVTAIATRNINNVAQSDWKIIGDMPLKLTVQ